MSLKVFNKFLDEESLLSADQQEQADSFAQDTCSDCKQKRLLPYSVALNIVLLVAGAALWLLPSLKVTKAYIPSEVFCEFFLINLADQVLTILAPAQSAVEYKTVVFSGGLRGDRSAFQGSSIAVDSKWEDLYNGKGTYSDVVWQFLLLMHALKISACPRYPQTWHLDCPMPPRPLPVTLPTTWCSSTSSTSSTASI